MGKKSEKVKARPTASDHKPNGVALTIVYYSMHQKCCFVSKNECLFTSAVNNVTFSKQ